MRSAEWIHSALRAPLTPVPYPLTPLTMPIRHESQLYAPIRRFLEQRGFEVRAEVEGCDVVATRGDELVVVELKRSMNLTLVLQGLDRQQATDHVYLAIETPKQRRGGPRWDLVRRLCRKLGMGLLSVTFSRRHATVFVECEPAPYRPRKTPARKERLLSELGGRSADYNIGGSTGRELVTAYREQALRVAHYLHVHGPSPVGKIRKHAEADRAGSILLKNVYGWFERVSRGVYRLTPDGKTTLVRYWHVVSDSETDCEPKSRRAG